MEEEMNGGREEMDDGMKGGREVKHMRLERRRMRRRMDWK